jgi:hypothetical protein
MRIFYDSPMQGLAERVAAGLDERVAARTPRV